MRNRDDLAKSRDSLRPCEAIWIRPGTVCRWLHRNSHPNNRPGGVAEELFEFVFARTVPSIVPNFGHVSDSATTPCQRPKTKKTSRSIIAETMKLQSTRRKIIGVIAATTASIAGCSGGDDGNASSQTDDGDDGPDSSGTADDPEDSDGQADGSDGSGGQSDGSEDDGSADGDAEDDGSDENDSTDDSEDQNEPSMPPPAERTFDGWAQEGYDARNTGNAVDEFGPSYVSLQWKYDGNELLDNPVVMDETVVIGNRVSDGTIYGIDATTGEEKWTVETDSLIDNSPAVYNGTVYVWTDSLRAIDLHDGTVLWREEIGDYPGGGSPTLHDDTLYLDNIDGNLYAIDPSDGTEKWRYSADQPVRTTPAVADGIVYAGTDTAAVFAVDTDDGSEIWSTSVPGDRFASSPVVEDGMVYFGDTVDSAYAVNASDGKVEWTAEIGYPMFRTAAIADGRVYFAIEDGLYAFDAATGSEEWSVGKKHFGSPVIADGTVYAGSNANRISAFDPETGEELWKYEPERNASNEPAVVEGTVFMGSDDGYVYALTEL